MNWPQGPAIAGRYPQAGAAANRHGTPESVPEVAPFGSACKRTDLQQIGKYNPDNSLLIKIDIFCLNRAAFCFIQS